MSQKLTHLDESGNIHMVDISGKPVSHRTAVARGEIHMKPETLSLIQAGDLKKGDVLATAKIAGIMAAKQTAHLIPLCHPLPLSSIDITFVPDPNLTGIVITASITVVSKTGAEMEALVAVSTAALTIYDMAKAVEKTMRIQNVRLIEKHGGTSGDVVNE
jgi:cyclic pyranopterin phosphate synthase